mmetsp:Transcript_47102/g.98647  ORF Transcript_47102/g.98647 Transcript_47102/m.98647 type:complete len:206 (-) Transcript_47102:60-677(-)
MLLLLHNETRRNLHRNHFDLRRAVSTLLTMSLPPLRTPLAIPTNNSTGNRHRNVVSVVHIIERNLHLHFCIRSTVSASLSTSEKGIKWTGRCILPFLVLLHSVVPRMVINHPQLLVRKNFIRSLDLLKKNFVSALVRMVLNTQLSKCFLYVSLRDIATKPEHFVVVALFLADHLSTAAASSSSLSVCRRVAAQSQKQYHARARGG